MNDLSPHEMALKYGLQVTRNSFGVPVTYARGATTLTIKRALQGDTRKDTIDVGGAEQVVEIQVWRIGTADLSALGPPESGDVITRTIDGTSYQFTVEALVIGEMPWDWSDTGKTQYVIQTRKDGSTAYEVSQPTGFDLSGTELR